MTTHKTSYPYPIPLVDLRYIYGLYVEICELTNIVPLGWEEPQKMGGDKIYSLNKKTNEPFKWDIEAQKLRQEYQVQTLTEVLDIINYSK